jgi:uncharacterized protein
MAGAKLDGKRTDETIVVSDGTELAAWLYRAEGEGPHPTVVLSHGFTALRRMGLDAYARVLQNAGMACVVYDHRNWGDSGGEPRYETDPWVQLGDMRDVVTWVRAHDDLDGERIGVWGTSYSGGHALMMGALDRRLRAVVAQVPLVDGDAFFGASLKGGGGERFLSRLAADRDGRWRGEPAKTVQSAVDGSTTAEWAAATDVEGVWPNRLTLRSLELVASYMPVHHTRRISPTPLLMIVAEHDEITPLEPQLAAFEGAREPKRLVRLDCRHYDVYVEPLLSRAADEARAFLVEHLGR